MISVFETVAQPLATFSLPPVDVRKKDNRDETHYAEQIAFTDFGMQPDNGCHASDG